VHAQSASDEPGLVAKYRPKYHTSSKELPEIANRARPKLLILYHQGYGVGGLSSEEDLIKEMRAADKGDFVSGHDLDMF
jgi:ribonuclease BN (tRNA processing enzyme)